MSFTGIILSSASIHVLRNGLDSILTQIPRLAAQYDLYPTYRKEFHELFEEFHEHPEFKPLLQRMNVVDANGETEMDEDQWEAASTSSLLSALHCCPLANRCDRYIHRVCYGKALTYRAGLELTNTCAMLAIIVNLQVGTYIILYCTE
jgi:hypothetical protein